MKNLIRKILRESDLGWMSDIPDRIDADFFDDKQGRINSTSYSMAKVIMDEFPGVDLELAIELLWENFPRDAENVYNWNVVHPRDYEYEGVLYRTDVDPYSGSIGYQPINVENQDKFYFYATPNYDAGMYGETPINLIYDDDYLRDAFTIQHPRFNSADEMKDYFKNQHYKDVTEIVARYFNERYDYYTQIGKNTP